MKNKYILGLDIGGTKIECALFKHQKRTVLNKISSQRIPTLRDRGYEDVMNRITALISSVLKEEDITIENILGLGAGLPGSVDPKTHKMINGNSAIFIGQDFVGDLSKKSGIKNIKMANDANLFALAETLQGAGKTYSLGNSISTAGLTGVGIILGTGCGGGLCIGGEIYTGIHGGGAEVGHSVLVSNGRQCYCGRRGCAEQYLSGSSVEEIFKERRPNGSPDLRASEIFELAMNLQVSSELRTLGAQLLTEYRNHLLEFLTNLTAIFDPHFFVLGGGVSTINSIYTDLEEKLWQNLFVKGSKQRVFQHKIGDSAGTLGAALLIDRPSE